MNSKTLQYITLALVVIIGCSQLYLFTRLQASKAGVSSANSMAPGATGTAVGTSSLAANVTVGDLAVAYQGYITKIQNSALEVKTPETTVNFSLSSNTQFYKPGTKKSNVEYSQEMQAYNAKVAELAKDPVKNAEALKAMNVPSQFNQIALKLSDFKVGDYVFVTPGAKNGDGSYTAALVALANDAAPQQ
ncbi:MAG TPA: hypothetical protein VIY48_12845 [Candidatus Paceibacterota bacterium]